MDSENIQRQIEIRKKQLIRQCDAIEQILQDYNVPKKAATLTFLTIKKNQPSERNFLTRKINYCRSMPKSINRVRNGPKLNQAIRGKKKYSNNVWRSTATTRRSSKEQ
ncbi:hypothetical protein Aduo_006265 [Ancylostoma duodenale]